MKLTKKNLEALKERLSESVKQVLDAADEALTTFLTSHCAIMYKEQKELLRAAILYSSGINRGNRLIDFISDFDVEEISFINLEDKLFLTEQFERFYGDAKEQQ